MNKERRKQIEDLINKIEECMAECETIGSEERDYYDNMPENMQSGDKGQAASDAADAIDSARDDLENSRDNLQQSMG